MGTADGTILAYDITDEPSFSISLRDVARGFSKRAIRQLIVLPRIKSLAILTEDKDSVIVCHFDTLDASVATKLVQTAGCVDMNVWAFDDDSTSVSQSDQFAAILRRSIVLCSASTDGVIRVKVREQLVYDIYQKLNHVFGIGIGCFFLSYMR